VFTAGWCDNCYFTYPLIVNFANRFTTEKVKILQLDVTRFESLAKAFKVNMNGVNKQLPTLILLEDQREYLRFPPLDLNTGKYA